MKKFIQKVWYKLISIIFPQYQYYSYLVPNSEFNYASKVGDGTSSCIIMAVIFWIMRRICEAPYTLIKNEKIIVKHEILSLLNNPNPYYSGRLLRMAIALSYNIDGNAYIIKIRNKDIKFH